MAEHESNVVVPTVTQPMSRSLLIDKASKSAVTEKVPVAPAPAPVAPAPASLDLDHGREPVTWAGGSLELVEVAEHRPTSVLDRDPVRTKWMAWGIGGSVALALILGFVASRGGKAEAGDQQDSQAAVEIPSAPEPAPAPAPPPEPEPEPKKAKAKKSSRSPASKSDSTLAAGSEQAASTSKPASSTSKPASSKPTPTPSKPTPSTPSTPSTTPSKPAGPNLAPPEEDGSSSKAELPDVQGWDDQDAAIGERTAEGV